jgi:hypothetical protein
MVWPPVAEKLVVKVAVPPASTVAVPRTRLPSMKVTVPVGVPVPGVTAATVAVKVTDWSVTTELGEALRAVAGAARLTVSATTAECWRRRRRSRRTTPSSSEDRRPATP